MIKESVVEEKAEIEGNEHFPMCTVCQKLIKIWVHYVLMGNTSSKESRSA